MKNHKVKTTKGTSMEVLSYDSKIKMFYCFVPHLYMTLTIHPSDLDLNEKELDILKMEMSQNEQKNN
jgi:hypothetical protein